MAEFRQTRKDLVETRVAIDQAKMDLFAHDQRILMLEKELESLKRQKGDNNGFIERTRQIEQQIAREKEKQATRREELNTISGRLFDLERSFEIFVDPRSELNEHFSNDTPFLLFPIRMETRFKTVRDKRQLWVRVYPDDCMVDSFEPLLSQREVNNAARFWAEFYSCGKPADPNNPEKAILDLQKSAWQLLVRAHGDGRAAWITRQLIPDAASVFPIRDAKTHILSIVTDSWNPAQANSVTSLFNDLWFANGNDQLITTIKEDFETNNPALKAQDIIDKYEPVNFYDKLPPDLKREEVVLKIAIVIFTDLSTKAGKINSWTQPSKVRILPERLALIRIKSGKQMEPIFGRHIPFPLPTSPDPSASKEEQFKPDTNGDLEFAEVVKWVADFDRAIDMGLGFRIDLANDEVDGFEKLLVLGVKLGADKEHGKKQVEELFEHHYFSKKGFGLVPQGTATNNTGSSDSGYSNSDFADESFALYFQNKSGFEEKDSLNKRKDGQWIAEWLGLDYGLFKKVLHSGGLDQCDVRNMNIALWPATLGYVMDAVMEAGFSDETIAMVRSFFNDYVSGRGPVPAIRIGNQPYGILPTTPFRRLTWVQPAPNHINRPFMLFLQNLYSVLLKMDAYFQNRFSTKVSTMTNPSSKPGQTILDVLSLHSNSVEFFRRYLESLDEVTNAAKFIEPGFKPGSPSQNATMQLLKTEFAYLAEPVPLLAMLLGMPSPTPITHLVDDVPLSEVKGIRAYTNTNKNYITALLEQARKSENAVRTGEGLKERPEAELYRLLKYAIEQSYHSSGIGAVATTNAFPKAELAAMKIEKPFVHQQWKGNVTESKYSLLYRTVPELSQNKTVSEMVTDSILLQQIPFYSQYLSSQLNALEELKDASTARLERALVEHIDCCSYRLDAWKMGLLTRQLGLMRNNGGSISNEQRKTGIFIGAFGWLENVRPERNKILREKQIPEDLKADFNANGKKIFITDDANEGFIHAPSLNQGITAAVLRNGYVSHGKQSGNSILAVNLTSDRVRSALHVIEGIQSGQSLAALLGYQLERELHDRDDLKLKKIDTYIYKLRRLFPLNADQLKETQVENSTDPSVDPDTVPITAIEARNVIHGVNLINHVKTSTQKNYPFGLDVTNDDADVANAITEGVNHILDVADALADLGIAESVHHMVMGNYDRATGVLDSFSKGNYPQAPDVIKTPRSGPTLTHRVSIPFVYTALATGSAPRVQTEPSMNQWLAAILPGLDKIICDCSYISRASGLPANRAVSMQDIGLTHLDLLYVINVTDTGQLSEIDDRIIHYLYSNTDPQLDANVKLNYTAEPSDPSKFSLFQLMPMIKSLRALMLQSPVLTPADLALPNETTKKDIPAPELPAQRVTELVSDLKGVLTNAKANTGIAGYLLGLPKKENATPAELAGIVNNADDTIDRFVEFLLELANFGIPQTSSGSLYIQRQQWFITLKDKLQVFINRWQKNSDVYNLLAANPAPTDEEVQAMERLITATPSPLGTITIASVTAKKALFTTNFNNLVNADAARQPTVIQLINDIRAIDTTPFDLASFELDKDIKQIILFIYDLKARIQSIIDELEKNKIPKTETLLASIPAMKPEDQVIKLEEAARIILGDSFKMIPRYILPSSQQAEISNSWMATSALLNYSKTTGKRTNPEEDWLHGIARVHEKMKHLENCLFMREAFGMNEADLAMHPAQLPFKSSQYHWMALPFPQNEIDMEESNILLYTAFVNQAAPAPGEVCGMLADEWNEQIPAIEETTGLTFHYDRPNCEAPQTFLLVTPAQSTGNWQWDDLVDSLLYTLEAAKARAIEPDLIDQTPFASLLPAVIAAESLYPFSIVLDNPAHYMTIAAIESTIQP